MKIDLKSKLEKLQLSDIERHATFMKKLCTLVLSAYFFAVVVSGAVASGFTSWALSAKNTHQNINVRRSRGVKFKEVNYRNLRKGVLDRNLFNSEGTFPDEKDPTQSVAETTVQDFDPKAACKDTKLPLTLLGTIYLGSPSQSMATVQEKGYSEADIYKVGDQIIGHEDATVAHIDRNSIVINNSGVKECISKAPPILNGDDDLEELIETSDVSSSPPTAPVEPSASGAVTLKESYVLAQLGDGFANILTKARLVPSYKDNKNNGFKIFGIDRSSLFGKVGLKNNDVITSVNGVELTADKGFEIYRAFQDESEVILNIIGKSGEPKTITVNIE